MIILLSTQNFEQLYKPDSLTSIIIIKELGRDFNNNKVSSFEDRELTTYKIFLQGKGFQNYPLK